MNTPTLHVTNWSSRSLHGTGRKFTIMVAPRAWEHGDGAIAELMPTLEDLRALRAGTLREAGDPRRDIDIYRDRFLARARPQLSSLRPACTPLDDHALRTVGGMLVLDGDTLCCACSRAMADAGACHRVWSAQLLVEAGWRVILDGREVSGG